jgi:hypothetical protein
MNLLTSDKSVRKRDLAAQSQIKLVSDISSDAGPRRAPNWLIVLAIVLAFVGGFGISFTGDLQTLPLNLRFKLPTFEYKFLRVTPLL